MIKVKAFYSGWHEVDKEQAKRFVTHLMDGMTGVKYKERAEYINAHNLKGITVKELLGD